MGEIVSYNPIEKEYKFNPESLWVETLWAAIYADNLSETAKIVFASMILYVREEPLHFPTQKELAEAVNKSTRTVERVVNELKNINIISVPSKGAGKYNKYKVNDHYSADLKFTDKSAHFLEELLNVEVPLFSTKKYTKNYGNKGEILQNKSYDSTTKNSEVVNEKDSDIPPDKNVGCKSNKNYRNSENVGENSENSTPPDKNGGWEQIPPDKNVGYFKEKEEKEKITKEKKERQKKESNIKKEKRKKIREKNKKEKEEKEIVDFIDNREIICNNGKNSNLEEKNSSSFPENIRDNSLEIKEVNFPENIESISLENNTEISTRNKGEKVSDITGDLENEKKDEKNTDLEEEKESLSQKEEDKYSHLTKAELRQLKIRRKREKTNAEKTLPGRSKKGTRSKDIPKDLSRWSPKHFRMHFGVRYKELSGDYMIRQPKKSNILIANVMKKGVSKNELKEVIDFVFDEWSEIKKRLKIESGYPSIGFVFSGYFETLLNMKRAGFSAHSFKDVRSDFDFELKLSDKEYKRKNDDT
ncbi:MAG: helix-turn-helix domain-containing protein [Elusimicrobiota bacterium]